MGDTTEEGGEGSLAAARAFVVHLRSGLNFGQGQLAGRVEHVVSGQSVHFRSLDELVGFLRQVVEGTKA